MTDGDKLRALADWHDANDKINGRSGTEVQNDLRRIANQVDRWVPTYTPIDPNIIVGDPQCDLNINGH